MASRDLHLKVKTTDESTGPLRNITSGWADLAGGLQIAEQVVRAAQQAYEELIVSTMEYAGEVRDLSLALGVGAEDASRVIQVLDDFEISAGDLDTAMRALRKEGFNPTVGTLAELSDQYLSLNSGLERQTFLAEHFGARTGQQFALAMSQGGDAIRRMNGEIDENLVLTEENIRQAEEYRLAVDALTDAKQGLTTQIGMALIPSLTALMENLTRTEDTVYVLEQRLERTTGATQYAARAVEGELAAAQEAARRRADEHTEALLRQSQAIELDTEQIYMFGHAIRLLPENRDVNIRFMAHVDPQLDDWWQRLGLTYTVADGTSFRVVTEGGHEVISQSGGPGYATPTGAIYSSEEDVERRYNTRGAVYVRGYNDGVRGTSSVAGDWAAANRAGGGQLSLGRWTMVGEEGPELVSPSGQVIPAGQTSDMQGTASAMLLKEIRGLRGDMSRLGHTLPIAIRDAMLEARG